MNWAEVANEWPRLVPGLKAKWNKLSDADLAAPEEKRALLVGALEKHYGIQKKHAELQLDRFIEKLIAGALPPVGAAPPAPGKDA